MYKGSSFETACVLEFGVLANKPKLGRLTGGRVCFSRYTTMFITNMDISSIQTLNTCEVLTRIALHAQLYRYCLSPGKSWVSRTTLARHKEWGRVVECINKKIYKEWWTQRWLGSFDVLTTGMPETSPQRHCTNRNRTRNQCIRSLR